MRETILTIVLLALIGGGGWFWYKYVREPSSSDSQVSQLEEERKQDERLRRYRQLNNLEPDLSLVDKPVFRALSSPESPTATTTIPRGRANPFAPF